MATSLRIVFDEWFTDRTVVGVAGIPLLSVHRGEEYLCPVGVRLRVSFADRVLGGRYRDEGERLRLESALLRFAVRRIERGLAAEEIPPGPTTEIQTFTVEEDDLPELAELLAEKTCDYQLRQGRDLLCSAASLRDETVTATEGHRRLAPTSRPICSRCNLPDTDVICASLAHPAITGARTKDSWSRQVVVALCDKGQPEIAQPAGCRPGGHACWERIVEPVEAATEPLLSPLSLPEQLDFLDAVWRVAFQQPLLKLESTAHAAGLALGCSSRDELTARLSDLADVLNGLRVPNELLGSGGAGVRGSLTRIERALEATRLDQDGKDRVATAMASLRSVVRIRVGLQHADATHELHEHFDKLKIAYPSTDWRRTWHQVRARTIDALVLVRNEVRRLAS